MFSLVFIIPVIYFSRHHMWVKFAKVRYVSASCAEGLPVEIVGTFMLIIVIILKTWIKQLRLQMVLSLKTFA